MDIKTLNQLYCTMMVLCFVSKFKDTPNGIKSCDCYLAPKNGLNGNDSYSYECTNIQELIKNLEAIASKSINSLVIDDSKSNTYSNNVVIENVQTQLSVISVIFSNFAQRNRRKFDLEMLRILDPSLLRHFRLSNTLFASSAAEIDWKVLAALPELNTIEVVGGELDQLNWNFSQITAPVHTLVFKSSQLSFIDPAALQGIAGQLRRMDLSNNQLSNFNFIQNVAPFTRLWWLDMSHNRLTSLPLKLKQWLPKVKTFYLEQNNFKWFDVQSLHSWLNVGELRLSTNDDNPILYLTPSLQQCILNLTQTEITSLYTVESFVHHYKYIVAWNQDFIKLDWSSLLSKKDLSNLVIREKFPDHLFISEPFPVISSKIKLKNLMSREFLLKPDISYLKPGKIREAVVKISGVGGPNLSTMTTERQYSRQLARLAELMTTPDSLRKYMTERSSLRVALFSRSMLLGWTSKELHSGQYRRLLTMARDLLDEAARHSVFILFVLWHAEDVAELLQDTGTVRDNHAWIQTNVIDPLLDVIADHDQLIGIELLDNGFVGYNPQSVPGNKPFDPMSTDDCPMVPQHCKQYKLYERFAFLQFLHSLLGNLARPIGLGMLSDCLNCFIMLNSDRYCLGFHLDFLTITDNVKSNMFGLRNAPYHDFYDTKMQVQLNATNPKGLIYVVQYGNAADLKQINENMNNWLTSVPLAYFFESKTI